MTILPALLAAAACAVEVTVYNSDLGLVKETRPFVLSAGVNRLEVDDVAARMDPTSVHFKSLTAPEAVSVLEQDFRYDLASPERLLERYLGREIELERPAGKDGARGETIRGTLLSSRGGLVLRSGGKVLVNPAGSPVLPELPEGLRTKPSLAWTLRCERSGEHRGEVSYLTEGLSWSADYVLVLDAGDARADLSAWVTVVNQSGAAYKEAKLKLVAGDVHRAPAPPRAFAAKVAALRAAESDAAVSERPFFEYHLYTLSRPATLEDNSSKQVELASAAGVPVKKLFVYDPSRDFPWPELSGDAAFDPGEGYAPDKKVAVLIELVNGKAQGLGIPLPRGRVRVYKKDEEGSLQFAGEDALDHTPKDETVRTRLGEAFDLVGERKRLSVSTDKRRLEESFEIRLRNRKEEAAVVAVVERLRPGKGWKILDASRPWTRKDARTIEFSVPVPAGGEAVTAYSVRYSW